MVKDDYEAMKILGPIFLSLGIVFFVSVNSVLGSAFVALGATFIAIAFTK